MEQSNSSTQYPDWKLASPKEARMNEALLNRTSGKVNTLLQKLLVDQEIHLYHSYANVVSVRRLGYNDHGPVHARITTYNALKILRLLHDADIKTSLESEAVATYEDSQVAVALGCFLHDAGMGVGRQDHEWHSVNLIDHILRRYLAEIYPDNLAMQVVIKAMAQEVIVGHMGHCRIHSVEAGVVLVADGTDMNRGRARIPQMLERDPAVGDIHRYSAHAIDRVELSAGEQKPVCITVNMSHEAGIFQIEEVLMTKLKASPIMQYVELVAKVDGQLPRHYLR